MIEVNWGWKIVVLYSSFIAFILMMVAFAASKKFDLVSADYYEQEIQYQGRLNKMANSRSLVTPLKVEYKMAQHQLILKFPEEAGQAEGQIHLYRPSNAAADQKIEIVTNDIGEQIIDISTLEKGMWKMQTDWTANGKAYYDENVIVIQ